MCTPLGDSLEEITDRIQNLLSTTHTMITPTTSVSMPTISVSIPQPSNKIGIIVGVVLGSLIIASVVITTAVVAVLVLHRRRRKEDGKEKKCGLIQPEKYGHTTVHVEKERRRETSNTHSTPYHMELVVSVDDQTASTQVKKEDRDGICLTHNVAYGEHADVVHSLNIQWTRNTAYGQIDKTRSADHRGNMDSTVDVEKCSVILGPLTTASKAVVSSVEHLNTKDEDYDYV